MKKSFLIVGSALVLGTVGSAVALAQSTPKTATPKASPAPSTSAQHSMDGQMGGGMMMGHGMMGGMSDGASGHDVMESCSCESSTKVDVKKLPNGVSITYTSDDTSQVERLQKRGEATRLLHESCGTSRKRSP